MHWEAGIVRSILPPSLLSMTSKFARTVCSLDQFTSAVSNIHCAVAHVSSLLQ